ncbi:MAG: hypothetical protein ABI700_00325 [Chloroflexota bacterium]
MSKATIVVDFAYKASKRRGRGTGPQALRATLKYLQYRDKLNNQLAQSHDYERWTDRGLGLHQAEILKTCQQLQSKHVLAWTWVISPDPDLMMRVPENDRRELLRHLTESVVEDYYAERGFNIPEYSYVMHQRMTKAEGDRPSREQLHTHVVLPGTAPSVVDRIPVYNNASKGHDALFREIATRNFETALDRNLGVDWRRVRAANANLADTLQRDEYDDFFSDR